MSHSIKQVKFDWKEMFKTDMEIAFKVTCVITLENDVSVEASEILKMHKGLVMPVSNGQQSGVNAIEMQALNNARNILNTLIN
ncbi:MULTISPECIES: hypothetical protein [Citrobacter]|uniref:hypothetical protein n=1 Tax=Citrobacter TaxID=544 RepID=UPI0009ADF5C9|nr:MULTISPECIES: hypothetical protein [Citrobacter]MDM2820872.1 hypothetical protein [Citrobacter sp. Cpo100]OPW88404.1 hypothetical protein BZK40_23195 [Citrobacter portucalensis]UMB86795.1 hypothetical protein I9P40_22715 [Citrobacter portucalensis]